MSTLRLPDDAIPIWTPRDAIDTAQAFHASIDQAERGLSVVDPKPRRWLSQSRYRKAGIMDTLAVLLLLALCAAFGCLMVLASAPYAKADTDTTSVAWAATYGELVCQNLDDHDSVPGLVGTAAGLIDQGLTTKQAGEVIALSINNICPRHLDLLARFINQYAGPSSVTA